MDASVELIMSEFGAQRKNAGGATLPVGRLNPALESLRRYVPNLTVTVYTDGLVDLPADVTIRVVQPPFDRAHPRYGWRAHDLFQATGLLNADADVAVALDADMCVVSKDVLAIIPLASKFGVCLPINSRHIVKREFNAVDGRALEDATNGNGTLPYTAFIACATRSPQARKLLLRFIRLLQEAPCRAPLLWWQASWDTGVVPYILPPQWCVGAGHVGIGDEIVLHVGHSAVRAHYGV